MNAQDTPRSVVEKPISGSSYSIVESIVEEKLEDIVTILSSENPGKSRLYEEILSMVEGILIKIALRRSNNIKSTASAFLGINRNTLHKKMEKLGISIEKVDR